MRLIAHADATKSIAMTETKEHKHVRLEDGHDDEPQTSTAGNDKFRYDEAFSRLSH